MQEMRAQIDALREAFSADKDKPFELKTSFPYGTPSDSYQPSPPMESQYQKFHMPEQESFNQQRSHSYPAQTMTPPISAVSRESGFDSPLPHQSRGGIAPTSNNPTNSMTSYTQTYHHQSIPTVDETQWNPTPIFHQWNTAFSIPQAALAPPATTSSTSPPMNFPVVSQQTTTNPISPSTSNPFITQYPTSAPQQQQTHQLPPTPQTPQTGYPPTSFVSSKQWQQSVASVFDPDGLKRRWTYSDLDGQPLKRIR
jgi:hypothetical protein